MLLVYVAFCLQTRKLEMKDYFGFDLPDPDFEVNVDSVVTTDN